MRKFAFQSVSWVFASLIVAVRWTSTLLLKVLGTTGYWAMSAVDPQRLSIYEKLQDNYDQPSELEVQSIELRLLASAVQVRDHAKETNDWTDRHTEALNAIGDALILESGWEEDAVHQYLRSLVESIDGLEYGLED